MLPLLHLQSMTAQELQQILKVCAASLEVEEVMTSFWTRLQEQGQIAGSINVSRVIRFEGSKPVVWKTLSPMPVALSQVACVSSTSLGGGAPNAAVLFGGRNVLGEETNHVFRYEAETDEFTAVNTLPFTARGLGSVNLAEQLTLVCGGYTGSENPLGNSYLYDHAANEFKKTSGRCNCGWKPAVVLDLQGKAHVLGGVKAVTGHRVYDPHADRWYADTVLPSKRYGHGACVGEDGRLFVFGGTHDPEIVHMLDPREGFWIVGAKMTDAALDFAWCQTHSHCFVVGGSTNPPSDSEPIFSDTWAFDIPMLRWHKMDGDSLPTPLRESCATMLGPSDSSLHVFGGSNGVPSASHFRAQH